MAFLCHIQDTALDPLVPSVIVSGRVYHAAALSCLECPCVSVLGLASTDGQQLTQSEHKRTGSCRGRFLHRV